MLFRSEVWSEGAGLLSGSLGNRESGISLAVADLGHQPSCRAQLWYGFGAAGVRVHDLQRAPLVREAKPVPSRLCRAVATDAQLWSGNLFGRSDDHRTNRLGLLLCAHGARVAAATQAAPAEGATAGFGGG